MLETARPLMFARANKMLDGKSGYLSPRDINNALPDASYTQRLQAYLQANTSSTPAKPEAIDIDSMLRSFLVAFVKDADTKLRKFAREWESTKQQQHHEKILEYQADQQELVTMIVKADEERQMEVAALKADIDNYQQAVEDLQSQLAAITESLDTLRIENASLEAEAQKREKESAELAAMLSDERIKSQSLCEEAEDAKQRLETACRELSTARNAASESAQKEAESVERCREAMQQAKTWEENYKNLARQTEFGEKAADVISELIEKLEGSAVIQGNKKSKNTGKTGKSVAKDEEVPLGLPGDEEPV